MKAENYIRISDARKDIFDAPRHHYINWIKDGSIEAIKFNTTGGKTAPYFILKESLIKHLETLQQPRPL